MWAGCKSGPGRPASEPANSRGGYGSHRATGTVAFHLSPERAARVHEWRRGWSYGLTSGSGLDAGAGCEARFAAGTSRDTDGIDLAHHREDARYGGRLIRGGGETPITSVSGVKLSKPHHMSG